MTRQNRFSVHWTALAVSDFRSILDYLADDSSAAAFGALRRIEEKVNSLEFFAHRGRVVRELSENGVYVYRELIIAPWRIVYRLYGVQAHIVAILDARRDLDDLLFERFLR